jgi:NAD(P)-dependent dehydrogenase (short-subunit alcohol dehydrogenase family)
MAQATPRKVIMLTGAAGGIGAQTARRLVEAGHHVALVDIDGPGIHRLSTELGDRTLAFQADVTSHTDLERAVAATTERFGRLDAAIANAGIEILGPLSTMPMADVERVIDVDLLGVWKTVRAALPEVIRSRGYILVVSSVSSATPGPFNAAYNAAKAGVVAMAKTLRLEVRGHGVRVGIAYFGYIDTVEGRRAVENPAMAEVMARAPAKMRTPSPVDDAAAALVRSVERRSTRVVVPRSLAPAIEFPELVQAIAERWLGRQPIRWRDSSER